MGSLEDLLMCSVCIDRYHEKDRQPVLLPRCGHSFCRTCVAMLVSSGCIVCPTCRTDQRIDCVDRLPTEYTLLAIINAQENYKKETCENHQVKLSFWCKTCETAACGECLFEDHPIHKHDILRSAKYISDMKQNSSDITTKFFDSLSKKEDSLFKVIFDCTTRISYAFKNISILRKDIDEARELMKNINQDATITSASTLYETAKFLGLKWNIQDANLILSGTKTSNEKSIIDEDDEISIEKARNKEKAKLEEAFNNKEVISKDKNKEKAKIEEGFNSTEVVSNDKNKEKAKIEEGFNSKEVASNDKNKEKAKIEEDFNSKEVASNDKNKEVLKLDNSTLPPSVEPMNLCEGKDTGKHGKSKRKSSKHEELNELEQLEKAIAESLKDQAALAEEIEKEGGKSCNDLSYCRKGKNGKKASRKRTNNVPLGSIDKQVEENEIMQVNKELREVTLDQGNLANDKDSISTDDKNANDENNSFDIDKEKPAENSTQIISKEQLKSNTPDSERLNSEVALSEKTELPDCLTSNAVNQICARLSDFIQVPGFMICVEGQNGRLGQITWGPQGLHVHALQFQQVDYDIVITVSLFNLLTPTVCPAVFLEICAEEDLLGRVYIRLWGNLRRASNFLSLCLGDEGNSYVNTKFLQVYSVGSPGERILGGDYEYNTGKGGRGILDDLEWNLDYAMPMNAGMITAAGSGQSANNSLFLICTQSDLSRNFSCPFGIVFEGLNVVKDAVKLTATKHVYISDCGVLILPPETSVKGITSNTT